MCLFIQLAHHIAQLSGKEWCPDLECRTGFTLVQFQRSFDTADANDLRLPVKGAKIGLIHAFSTKDPVIDIMVQHTSSSTGSRVFFN